MAEEANLEGEVVYKCMKCGYFYNDIEKAEECEKWCRKHKSCNLDITQHAIKIK